MSRHDEIKASYKQLGNTGTVYDGIVTRSTLIGKLLDSLVWGLNKELAAKWIEDALAPIPEDFAGKLLEVPVGTGVLTMPLYKKLAGADITCLDYSADMMKNAEKRAEAMGTSNVRFVQGDVGALPFEDGRFDIVLSLNGFRDAGAAADSVHHPAGDVHDRALSRENRCAEEWRMENGKWKMNGLGDG